MSRDHMRQLATAFYDDFLSAKDLVLFSKKYFTDETVWEIFLPENVPYGGTYRGRENILGYLGAVFENMTLSHFEVKNIIVGDDSVVVFVMESAEITLTSRSLTMESIHVLRFKDEKITYCREYCDTNAMAVAFSP